MPRPLGVSSTMLGEQLTAEALREAAARGITHLELFVPPDGCACATEVEFLRIAAMIEEAGMTAWAVHAPFGEGIDLSAPDELVRREALGQVLRACKVAGLLGANCAVVHAGLATGDDQERQARRRQSLRSLNCLLKSTIRLGTRLAVEYLPGNKPRLCNNSAEILDIFGFCDGTPGVCLDTNHVNLREDLAEATRTLADRIVTLHLSDNDGEREMHQMPGEGVIDWTEFMAVLDEIGYNGPLLYETAPGDSLERCLDETVRSAREVLGWEGPDD